MPVFEEDNLEGWIFPAERFFSVHHLIKVEKLDVATLSCDGEPLAWF